MSSNNKDQSNNKKKPSKSFRFIIRDDENLKEINSFILSKTNIYLLVSSILLLIGIILISLLVFTPLKRLIPGYGDINNNMVFVELNEEITGLEKQIEEQITYTESLKKIIFQTVEPNQNILHDDHDGHDKLGHSTTTSMITNSPSSNVIPFLIPPVKGNLSMGYMIKKDHFGIDIVCEKNAEVKSIAPGVILNTVWDPMTGNTISIQHPNNLISIYKHNAAILKKTGDRVAAGEAIAIVGSTGEQSTGPHLHFELWSNGQAVNPELFINF